MHGVNQALAITGMTFLKQTHVKFLKYKVFKKRYSLIIFYEFLGSDKRGTIYGLYDISEQIGVSPWYYWADVPPKSHDIICAFRTTKTPASPSVKYRGIYSMMKH